MVENTRHIAVSAVVTTFKRPDDVRRALASVVSQTYPLAEIIVIEDGPATELGEWIHRNYGNRVRYIAHGVNKGLPAARNTGLRESTGDYIAYLDDDDVWKPERIRKQVDVLSALPVSERKQIGVVTCKTEMHFPKSGRISVRPYGNVGPLKEAIIREGARTPSSSFLFAREALERVGGFDESLASSVDHDIWMALAVEGYSGAAADEPLVVHFDRFARSTAMSSTLRRIQGVRQYVSKWQPTYRDWLGSHEGDARMRRYVATVMGHLAAGKLATGVFDEAWKAYRTAAADSKLPWYASGVVVSRVLFLWAQQLLPSRIIAVAKSMRRSPG